jgi:hypothetical protein
MSPNHNKVYRTHNEMPDQTKIHKFYIEQKKGKNINYQVKAKPR